VLGAEDGALFCRVYDITPGGNFEGKSIPNLIARSVEERAAELGVDPAALWAKLDALRERLREARSHRVWPGLDDKVLTAWNALMIRAMSAGYRVLGDDRYRTAAERAAEFILTTMQEGGRLLRSYRNRRARLNGYLEDYSFFIVALLDLHDVTQEARWAAEAQRLLEVMNEQFWDAGQGGYFFTAHDHEPLIARMKSNEDGAIPSGNSMAALALIRLAALADRPDYREKAGRLFASYAEMLRRAPAAFANMLLAADLYQEGVGCSVLDVGSDSDRSADAGPNPQHPTPNPPLRIEAGGALVDGRMHIEVRLVIPEGWHINSHRPLQDYLRPTELRLEPGEPYRLLRVDYPEGELLSLPFDPEPLSVYQGMVTLVAEVEAPPSLGAGEATIPLRISYQPCSDRECLTPAEAAVAVRVTEDKP
jgi:hypothetical protein